MAVLAVQRMVEGLSCLALRPDCGVDLRMFHGRVLAWFGGEPIPALSTLPPQSYPLLWPLIGWLPEPVAPPVWAATSLLALLWLALILARESGAETLAERLFVLLLPFSMYAAHSVLLHGQIILHLLPPLLAGLLLLLRGRPSWGRDLVGAALLEVALAKPTVSAPFLVLIAARGARLRPLGLVALAYTALTLLAASFRPEDPLAVFETWVRGGVRQAALQHGIFGAYGSLHDWLGALGLDRWNWAASLLAILLVGWWVHSHRRADLWIQIGITAVVARLWTYHHLYDDMLIVLTLVALFRVAKLGTPHGDWAAGLVLAVGWAGAVLPARLFLLPQPWTSLVFTGEVLTWLAALGYLVIAARRSAPSPAR